VYPDGPPGYDRWKTTPPEDDGPDECPRCKGDVVRVDSGGWSHWECTDRQPDEDDGKDHCGWTSEDYDPGEDEPPCRDDEGD